MSMGRLVSFIAAIGMGLVLACKTTGSGTGGSGGANKVIVAPMCTMHAVLFSENPKNRAAIVAERTDAGIDHGFTPFRGIRGPRGNTAVGFRADVYGFSEAWLRVPGAPEVHRAQATPRRRDAGGGTTDFEASAWSITAQDSSGTWSVPFAAGTAARSNDVDTPEEGGLTVPQLMPVGVANPQMFACAGERTEDDTGRTTWLIESVSRTATRTGGVTFIQDLLNGDDRFVPNRPGPLVGPSRPPQPSVSGPGNPIRGGSVKCAMTQLEDDLATRELHMLGLHNGVLYHSMASDFGPVTEESGSVFSRFRAVSPWSDVGQTLGGGFGNITSAAIVASRPTAISIFFVAESGGVHRLWHAVRFSAGGGSWRPPDDVLLLNGDAPTGSVQPWQVSAGTCPEMGAVTWTPANTEVVVALWGGPSGFELMVLRVLSTPREWRPGVTGIYSPRRHVTTFFRSTTEAERNPRVKDVTVSGRPFRDDARPPPPPEP